MNLLRRLGRKISPEARLVYTYRRCECGALYAHKPGDPQQAWDCSDIILGLAAPAGHPGAVRHGDTLPFIFWAVKEAPLDWALAHRVDRPA